MVNGIEHIKHNFNIQIGFSFLCSIILNDGFQGLSFEREANMPKKIQESLLPRFRRSFHSDIINGIYDFAFGSDEIKKLLGINPPSKPSLHVKEVRPINEN